MAGKECPGFIEIDKPRDHCAVAGIMSFTGRDVAPLTRLALQAQQNRGEDGSGIAAYGEYSGTFKVYKDVGLVAQAFPDGKLEEKEISGFLAIGHNRYATSGDRRDDLSKKRSCLQPYVVGFNKKSLALAHNGNIPEKYLEKLREELPVGVPFQSDSDSEIIAWRILFARGNSWHEKVKNGLSGVVGAYSLAIATDDGDLFGAKDPRGIRPLAFARTQDGVALVSETRGLEYMKGVIERREVGNGQLVHITKNGEISVDQIFPKVKSASCLFEPVYFKNPHSQEGEREVRVIRERMGEMLTKEVQFPLDFAIVGVPDSGIEIAEGYAWTSGRRMEHLIRKDRYRPGRTFISDSIDKRKNMLELKFTISDEVRDKKLVIVDDSVIRGNTTKRLVSTLRERGAREIHVLSGSPKVIDSCNLGIDIATLDELVALKKNGGKDFVVKSDEEIAREIGADSIHYLSLDGLIRAIGENGFCTNCLTRTHPIEELGDDINQIYRARSGELEYMAS